MKYKISLTKKVKRAKIKMRRNLIFLVKVYFWVEVYLFALHTIFYKRYKVELRRGKAETHFYQCYLLCRRHFFYVNF
jgi:hypothetical protein